MSEPSRARPIAAIPTVWIDRVGPVDGVDVIAWDMDRPCPVDALDYACVPYQNSPDVWGYLATARIGCVQLLSAGFEDALGRIGEGSALSNARGVHDAATAEQALALVLAMQRGAWRWVENHRERHWTGLGFQPGIADQRVVVLGYGSIGSAVARRIAAFEPKSLTAIASRPRAGDDLVDRVHGVEELLHLLPSCDILVSVLPGGDATRGLLDARALAALPEGALVVNIGRGTVVDTDALVEACASERIRAGLDVTDPEPLPDDHPLWSTPGVLVSPHVGGLAMGFWSRAAALLRRQLERLAAGERLENIVN
ncbi:NAD(P)-dependent oxidoreductase [Actinomyces culturomici]|uniref:NAD(P)-dependent oxidoreductase n=1 Tax=Actinomyces culturomici TaxID=1926276 RepID=UPI000E1FC0DD|nr:NAD(P)-dependent oxidoreductase [Actinomyces culturomici]